MKLLKPALLGAFLLLSGVLFASYASPEGTGHVGDTASYAAPEGNGHIDTALRAAQSPGPRQPSWVSETSL